MSEFTSQPQDDDAARRSSGELVPHHGNTAISPQNVWQPPTPVWLDADTANEGMNVVGFLHAVRRRWLPGFLIGSVVATVIAALMWLLIPTSYEAIGWIRVRRTVPQLISSQRPGETDQEYAVFKQTQQETMRSPYVLQEALRDEQNMQTLEMIQNEEKPLAWLQKNLQVSYLSNSELLRVAIRGDDLEQPVKIVDAVMNAFLERYKQEERILESDRLTTLRNERQANVRAITSTLDEIHELGEVTGAIDNLQAQIKRNLELSKLHRIDESLRELSDEIGSLQNQMYLLSVFRASRVDEVNPLDIEELLDQYPDYYQLKAFVRQIRNEMQDLAAQNVPSVSMQQLQAQLTKYQQQLKERRKELEPRVVLRLQRAQGYNDALERNNLTLFQADLQIKQRQLKEMETEYKDQLATVQSLAQANSQLDLKKMELEALERTNTSIQEEIDRIQLNMGSQQRISIMQPAIIPDLSNFRIKLLGIAAAWLGVLGVTVFGIAMWDYVEKHLNAPGEVERNLKLRVLGSLPDLRAGGLLRSLSGPIHESVVADSIDSIRTAILYGEKGVKAKSLIVTSATEKEGKTTVASQLAVSLARAGKRTLLIDGDLRNPRQHAVFGLPPDCGLSEVLRGDAQLEEVIQSTPAESLWILPAGQCTMASLQAMAGPAIGSIMDWCAEQFDHVVVDCSPTLVGAEAMMFGQHVDAAILAVRRDVSRLPKIEEAVRRLNTVGVRVLGTVVNGGNTETRRNQLAIVSHA